MDFSKILSGRNLEVVSALAVTGVIIGVWYFKRRQKKPGPFVMVGKLGEIRFYPIKSMGVVELDEALCSPVGLQLPGTNVFDRTFVVTNREYNFINLKQKPSLALVIPSIHGNEIHLKAPNMDPLVIKLTTAEANCTVTVLGQPKSARDCGEEASKWFSTYLQREGVRLCQSVPGPIKRIIREDTREIYMPFTRAPQIKPDDQVEFPDASPFMICSDSSLDELNSRTKKPVTMGYFRPSLVISGCPPFDEDTWREMKIGDARFSFFKPNASCAATQVDPATGTRRKDLEPLSTLNTYRMVEPLLGKKPIFGTHWVLDHPGIIKVGDLVYITKK